MNDKGEYFPVLVEEVPTVKNDGVSADGLTITYKLKKGVTWSDGAPFTSDDIKFTWEAIVNPKNLVKSRSGYDLIQSVSTPDRCTAVVKYKVFYAPYLTRFAPVLQPSISWETCPTSTTRPTIGSRWEPVRSWSPNGCRAITSPCSRTSIIGKRTR